MDKYEKIKVVGRGAHGTVFLCARKCDQQLVIVKQIPVDSMSNMEKESAFGEAQLMQMLTHPFIIGYYDNFLGPDDTLCIVMEYAQGGTLAEFLKDRKGTLMDEKNILFLFAQLTLSLHQLHKQSILHRDLKTQNILLNKDRTTMMTGRTKLSTVVGTPNYMSPELCQGKPYNQKSDMWSLGCILYELTTLKRAFEAENLNALVMKIMRGQTIPISDHYSDSLKKLINQLHNLDPDKRPTTNSLLAYPILIRPVFDIVGSLGSIPGPAKPPTRTPTLTPKTAHKLNTSLKQSPKSLNRHQISISVSTPTSPETERSVGGGSSMKRNDPVSAATATPSSDTSKTNSEN